MELLKEESPLEFRFQDVVFLVKSRATAHDKFLFESATAGNIVGGEVKLDYASFVSILLRAFVVGWKGVTQDGKPVPYSYDLMVKAFPSDKEDSAFFKLAGFIVENTDIFKKDIELKKESPPQPVGV